MIVCICNAYRSAEIAAKAREIPRGATGHGDVHAVYEALGAGPRCGCCLDTAQDIIDEATGCCRRRLLAAE
jgi:bacterioferritin-associated ferredoxin